MNVLDSPLEALLFDYVSFGIFTLVNNVWPWVAVITAAVSFWRIRAGGAATSCSLKSDRSSSVSSSQPNPEASADDHEEPPATSSNSAHPASVPAAAALSPTSVCDDGVKKGKFTVYYEDEEESDGKVTVAVEEWGKGEEVIDEWWESWERVLRMRRGGNGWYRFQDLTAIDGNVVRLWDGSRRGK